MIEVPRGIRARECLWWEYGAFREMVQLPLLENGVAR